jgi:hypothetical protein
MKRNLKKSKENKGNFIRKQGDGKKRATKQREKEN